ncbi:dihydropteroate synthase [Helicobacter sp. 23-1045]
MFIWRMKFLDFGGIGATKFARFCGAKKGRVFYFKISDLGVSTALILKQEAISVGGDFITPKELILGEGGCYDGILIATHHQLEKLVKKCAIQPFGLKKIGEILQEHLDSTNRRISPKNAESKIDSSLRGARSEASATKQSKKNNNLDCHDFATQNLAMTENNTDSAIQIKNAESSANCHIDSHFCHIERSEISQKNRDSSLVSLTQNDNVNIANPPNLAQIMGIININDDSFFAESRLKNIDKILQKIEAMISQGVAIIDIGAVSSRPGAERVDGKVELERLKEPLDAIFSAGFTQRADFSLDSYNFECVEFALNRGFSIINDIEGLRDMRLATLAQNSDKKIVLMHNSWIYPPKDSQNIIHAVDDFFAQKLESLYRFGIKKEQIILDFGFGFGKTDSENITLTRNLAHFRHFGCALLVGASMKRTIGALTEQETQNRLFGTLALHQIALDNGADIIRCHNFSAHIDMLKVWSALNGGVRD